MSCSLNENWPVQLNGCMTASKSRQQPEGYVLNNVNAGAPFAEIKTDDLPTTWDITFKFNQDDARLFTIWLYKNNLRYGFQWFDFPVQLEEGLTTQEVGFLKYPQATGHDGNVFTYSAQIISRVVAVTDATEDVC